MKNIPRNNKENFIESLKNCNIDQSLTYLEKFGNSINEPLDDDGNTALHLGVQYNNFFVINYIFEEMIIHKIDFSIHNLPKNKLGYTALQLAIINSSPKIQYCFAPYLFKGPYPEIFSYVTEEINLYKEHASLIYLYSEGLTDLNKMKLFNNILDIAPLYLNIPDKKGMNVLILTMIHSTSLFETVLNSPYLDPVLINKKYSFVANYNCALIAAERYNFEALKLLLKHDKFDKNLVNDLDAMGQSLLFYIMAGPNDFETIKLLINYGANINIQASNNEKMSILLYYTLSINYNREQCYSIVDYLINQGGKFIIKENTHLENKILNAVFYNRKEELKLLLNEVNLKYDVPNTFKNISLILTQAMLLALKNHHFSLIDKIMFKVEEINNNNSEQINFLKYRLTIKERIVKAKEEYKNLETAHKAILLSEIANIFIDKSIYMKALEKLEELLRISLPHDKIAQLKELDFDLLTFMGFSLPYKEIKGRNVKLDNELTKIIYSILQKHGFNANELFYFAGFAPNDKADNIAVESLFQESISSSSILHGIKTHILQVAIICILLDLNLIKSNKNYNAKDIVRFIIEEDNKFDCSLKMNMEEILTKGLSLWQYMFDFYFWDHGNKNNILFSPQAFNLNLMNSINELPIISTLMRKTFVNKLQILCNIVNSRSYEEKLTPEHAIFCMIAGKEKFQTCDFEITDKELKKYYEPKQADNIDCDKKVEFQGESGKYTIITKKSPTFVSALAARRKLYEETIKDYSSQQNGLS